MNQNDDPREVNKHLGKPFQPTCVLPKNAAGAIARMRLQLTTADANQLQPALWCPCDERSNSPMHTLQHVPRWTTEPATLLKVYHGPGNWTDLKGKNNIPKALLWSMNQTRLIRVRKIITNKEGMRDVDNELGADK